MDAGWTYGAMVSPKTPIEPPGLGDGSAAALLDEAENFLNEVGPQVMAEVHAERAMRETQEQHSWKRFLPRRRKG